MLNRILKTVIAMSSDMPVCNNRADSSGMGRGYGRGRNRRSRGKFSGPINTIISFAVTAAVHDLMKKDSVIKGICRNALGFITGKPPVQNNLIDNKIEDDHNIIEIDAEVIEKKK